MSGFEVLAISKLPQKESVTSHVLTDDARLKNVNLVIYVRERSKLIT